MEEVRNDQSNSRGRGGGGNTTKMLNGGGENLFHACTSCL